MLDANLLWMSNWKWIVLISGTVIGFLSLSPTESFCWWLKKKYSEHNKLHASIRYFLQKDIQKPVSWLVATGIWSLTFQVFLDLHEMVARILALILHLIVLINIIRLAYLAVDAFGEIIEEFAERSGSSMDGQLGPFATRVLKILVIVFGFLLSLQSLGFNVGALLAGLGIGSLAFALAAQDTVANLFGSITLIFDRPFQLKDYVKVGDLEGTIEQVGFRSTQIRTPNRTLITVPNAIMAKEKIENVSARNYRRFFQTLHFTLNNEPTQLQNFVEAVKGLLQQDPVVVQNDIAVALTSLSNFDCKVVLDCLLRVSSSDEELRQQEKLLLQILQLARELSLRFKEPNEFPS